MTSAIINNSTLRKLLHKIIQGRYVLITSEQIINELEHVLSRLKFKMDKSKIKKIINAVIYLSDIKQTKSKFKIVTDDPDDDVFINTAHDGEQIILCLTIKIC